jgi:membrane fusion protein (multidrug efflux system)
VRHLALIPVLLLLFACAEEPPPRPIPEVVVAPVIVEPYRPKFSFVGRLNAKDDVTIEARVSGYLLTRDFREGEVVKAGDVLYTIDPSEYEAALARARADLAAATANQANADRAYRRGKDLLPRGAISQAEMDDLTARKLDADAGIKSAEAQIKSAEVNLGFTTIRAPISGRIGRTRHSPGDLVGPTTGTLTTLVSIDPIQALFRISEQAYIASLTFIGDGTALEEEDTGNLEVSLELTNGQFYPLVGSVDYLANRIDESTGTLEARAQIPNPGGVLVPGQYVQVVLQETRLLEGLFLPQAAVQADQQGSFVMVVNANYEVERRNVLLDRRVDDKVLVRQGVEEGEEVIVLGLQQVRRGMTVKKKSLAASGG